jgi:hypothetical protein
MKEGNTKNFSETAGYTEYDVVLVPSLVITKDDCGIVVVHRYPTVSCFVC